MNRVTGLLLATAVLAAPMLPARADNAMGYKLLTPQDAAMLPHNHGALGMDVERGSQITDSGMTFDVMRVKQVRRGSAGAAAGLHPGDQIIAVDGFVFPTIATFAAYVGSIEPGTQIAVDMIPAGGGPAQAQRVRVTIGAPAQVNAPPPSPGLSTGSKIAIGVGAAALLGCYEMGCFSHRAPAGAPQSPQPSQ